MAIEVFNLIADFFYTIFGSGLVFTAVLLLFLIITMIVLRANITAILIVIIPLVAGILLNSAGSNLLTIPAWILIVLFILAGLMFSLFFIWFIK